MVNEYHQRGMRELVCAQVQLVQSGKIMIYVVKHIRELSAMDLQSFASMGDDARIGVFLTPHWCLWRQVHALS